MTIEEAIKHCEEVAAGKTEQGECIECAEEHKQLSEWLRELISLRAQHTLLDRSQWEECEHCAKSCQNCVDLRRCGRSMPPDFSCWKAIIGLPEYCSWCGRPLNEEAWAELERRINNETVNMDMPC